jgi:hypothetical protein
MAIGVYFAPESMSLEQYEGILRRLAEAGAGAPEGRSFHCAFELGGSVHTFDVWESQEALDAFGEILVPILLDVGVQPGDPTVAPVHNVIVG